MGIGPHVMFGREEMGVGTGGWLHAEVVDDVELVLRGHGTDFFRYDGAAKGDGGVLDDVFAGGSAGIRGRYRYTDTLLLGGEALVDYQVRTSTGQHFLSGIVGLPVAEQAAPGLWVYTDITLGIAIPLHENPDVPFFGFQEIPLGIAWQPAEWMLLVAEGGFALAVENGGGYGGVAVAFRL